MIWLGRTGQDLRVVQLIVMNVQDSLGLTIDANIILVHDTYKWNLRLDIHSFGTYEMLFSIFQSLLYDNLTMVSLYILICGIEH